MTAESVAAYQPQHPIRIVTAASLFDGHDAAINVMRRILQSSGAEVIHLGHNRSVAEIVDCAIQEDAQGIAITSYQGGHIEYLRYMFDLLKERGASQVRIVGGGGGTILPSEIEELHDYGIARVFSPDDGRSLGLQGMINEVLELCDFAAGDGQLNGQVQSLADAASICAPGTEPDARTIAQLITLAENHPELADELSAQLHSALSGAVVPVLGITGTGGSGKSSLVDELVRRFLVACPGKTIAVISIDPSKRRSGGALLGDRIRMNAIDDPRVYMRSLATRQSNLALSRHVQESIDICKVAGFNLIIVETSGIGQSDTEIVEHCDVSLYVMTAEYGAATQLEKIDMLDFADIISINKFDKRGSLDALRDVRKQYRRNHEQFDGADDDLPIHGTVASQFNDNGTNRLFTALITSLEKSTGVSLGMTSPLPDNDETVSALIPPDRVRYLAEIVEASETYDRLVVEQSGLARQLYQLHGTIETLRASVGTKSLEIDAAADTGLVRVVEHEQGEPAGLAELVDLYESLKLNLDGKCRQLLEEWPAMQQRYRAKRYQFEVRGKVLEQPLTTESLSHIELPRVSLPRYHDWGDILTWLLTENAPGYFPYAAGVFPLKRQGEDPARMFAGEGGPERTNRRFHYVSRGLPAKRLSTAFDSVTLYGE
ncbi:MAG: methylmalonyl-CoA mutase, partial [Pseudohongiellaceae bacterium]